jgi:N utilization substance protein B
VSTRGRHGARRLLLQALYQRQIAGHDGAALREQFSAAEDFAAADGDYFIELLDEIVSGHAELDELIDAHADRPVAQIDPIERAVLWIGVAELRSHQDVPANAVINEAVELAKEFGAQDGYRYINAILDSAARVLR